MTPLLSAATINPVAFEIFGRPVYWYGILFATGFLAATFHWSVVMRRRGHPVHYGSDLAFWIIVGGVIGARLVYVAGSLPDYLAHPLHILRIDQGGLVYYGGLIGGALAVILFARRRGMSPWEVGDVAISGLPLGHAMGRFGCFLNGCCYGSETTCSLAATFKDGLERHPTQLYEAGFNLLLYGLLLLYYPRRKRPGEVLALYLLLYTPFRAALQMLRDDDYPASLLPFLDQAQLISLLLFAAGAILWIRCRRRSDA